MKKSSKNVAIGDKKPVFIIAEAGINHNGKIKIAKKLIEEAKKSGADAIKFQLFQAEKLCSKKSGYFKDLKSKEFTKEEWREISEKAEKEKITFTASVFDKESADFLEELGSPLYKIASGDITHIPLLEYISKKKKPVILSTGMSNLGEVEKALNTLKTDKNEVSLLHCVSNYPAHTKDLNLKVIKTLKSCFKVPVGFSDHTKGIDASLISVALGADIIEKHFTLDKTLDGPDHQLSLEPSNFRKMVGKIRETERALGSGIKKLAKSEVGGRKRARRSIITKRKLKKGKKLQKSDIKIVRPGTGIKPENIEIVLGRKIRKTIKKDEPLQWGKIWIYLQ